jgi:ERCC4-type nuclease
MGQRQGHHPAMGAGTAGGSKATAPTPGLLPGPRIVADSREQAGSVVKHLHGLGAAVETRRLDIADYVLSDRVAVERKSTKDFVDSLVDGRLFEQLKELRTYPRAFLVIEGASMYGHRNVAPEALLGALASAVTDFGVPVLRTEDALETARFLVAVAKREQGRENRKVAVRPAGPGMGDAERQMHLVAGLPGVDAVRADALLRHFGSAAAVFAASEAALAEAPHVGPKTARMIRELLDQPYE